MPATVKPHVRTENINNGEDGSGTVVTILIALESLPPKFGDNGAGVGHWIDNGEPQHEMDDTRPEKQHRHLRTHTTNILSILKTKRKPGSTAMSNKTMTEVLLSN